MNTTTCTAPAALPLFIDANGDLDLLALLDATADAPTGAYADCAFGAHPHHLPTIAAIPVPHRTWTAC